MTRPGTARRLRVVVRGRVQGVGFRVSAASAARGLGVTGLVRNLPDGGVEAEIEGDPPALQAMVEYLGQGPPGARVTGVDVQRMAPRGDAGFRVEP